jgi:hypothetical protein
MQKHRPRWAHIGSAEMTLCWPILAFHVVSSSWLLIHSRGAHAILTKLPKANK